MTKYDGIDISVNVYNAWTIKSLVGIVPVGTIAIGCWVYPTNYGGKVVGLCGGDETPPPDTYISVWGLGFRICKVAADLTIKEKLTDANTKVKLVWSMLENEGLVWLANEVEKTPNLTSQWVDTACVEIPPNAVAIFREEGVYANTGMRVKNETIEFREVSNPRGTNCTPVDAQGKCELYTSSLSRKTFLKGYFHTKAIKLSAYDITPTVPDVFQDRSVEGDAPANSTMVLLIRNMSKSQWKFFNRYDGSSFYFTADNTDLVPSVIPLVNNIFEAKQSEITTMKTFLLAYIGNPTGYYYEMLRRSRRAA